MTDRVDFVLSSLPLGMPKSMDPQVQIADPQCRFGCPVWGHPICYLPKLLK
jgi:hypothetical protein